MALFTLSDLVTWSEKLPLWQRDALRRILDEGAASASRAELAALAKAPYLPSSANRPQAVPPTERKPQPKEVRLPSVRLVAIRDIARVNAIGEGPVPFGIAGLTVVFGPNASGKSGISRILKKSCRASDPGGKVRPNVFEPEPTEPATATIQFQVDGVDREHEWRDGGKRDGDLQTINVFDAACAAVQVEKKNVISYTPAILKVFRDLVKVTDDVATILRTEQSALGFRPRALNDLGLPTGTKAGDFVAKLTRASNTSDLDRLCNISEEEHQRLAALGRALADDPLQWAQVVETRAKRLGELDVQATRAQEVLSDEACDALVACIKAEGTAQMATQVARASFAAQSMPLEGVGTTEWAALWNAARRFSEQHAYPSQVFPVVGDKARCVLCQQDLQEETSGRLLSFEEFVKAEVQQGADKATKALAERTEGIVSLTLPSSVRETLRDAGLSELAEIHALRRALVTSKLRRRFLVQTLAESTTGTRPVLSTPPDLTELRTDLTEEAKRLRAAAQGTERSRMQAERSDLEARIELAKHVASVRQEIERLKSSWLLESAIADCKTQAITREASTVAKDVVTNKLRSNFTTNLVALGFGETPVEVQVGGGEKATHPYELKLMARPDVPPVEVLSESERTCVALAGMLAELETTGNSSSLVLDDPVSSLDQPYRKRVAERLVHESKSRQVIIFTHDVVFLFLLRKYAKELDAVVTEVSLRRGYKANHGRVTEGPPWEAMGIKQRITSLRDDLTKARKRLKESSDWDAYQREGSELYKRLRQSWERAVEEVLLNQTVLRFGDSVQTQRLAKLADITDDDITLVTKETSRCSDFVHDEAATVRADVPDADVIEADIKRLDEWVKILRAQRGR